MKEIVLQTYIKIGHICMRKKPKPAGAELCQAQYKLDLAKFLFGSVASLKFECLFHTGVVAIVNNQK